MANLSYQEIAEISTESLPSPSLDALKNLRNQACETTAQSGFKLQSQQRFLRRVLSPDSPLRSLLMVHGTGSGKCHGLDTPILMFDGSSRMVQDVEVGDLLMGDDSTPRRVMSLARGRDLMYEILSIKGDKYVVNSEHILCLQHTSTRGAITEIEVRDFLKLSKKTQRNLKGYRVPVSFQPSEVELDPYILGVWLGDGSQRDPVISSQDAVILSYLRTFCHENNAVLTFQSGYDYRISAISKDYPNTLLQFLKGHNLINNKHVPENYKINSKDIRLQLLAGLIDTDGYLSESVYEIIQKSKQLADDIIFIARSLGFGVTCRLVEKSCMYKGERRVGNYYRMFISGNIDEIPVKILRKQASSRRQIKDVLRYGITVSSLGEGDYYGFTLDGNNRYLLGDFTVTHNTCTAIQIAEEYILRPEFQEKKVMVVASAAVQENFRVQLFEMNRVKIDAVAGTLESKQCTGRRYLDMLLRIESEPKNWNNPEVRAKLERTADRIISEFYDFNAYGAFGNLIQSKLGGTEADIDRKWVHDNFDNRLLLIDEAHNIRESKDDEGAKGITRGLENLVKTADGLVLVFLTATPMFDTYEEIVFYMNLFLWNERKQDMKTRLKIDDFFNDDGTLKPKGAEFRTWCQNYVSYVKGENPFTFPFRLSPPKVVARDALTTSYIGKAITAGERIKYLDLYGSMANGIQKTVLTKDHGEKDNEAKKRSLIQSTLAVLPGNKDFDSVFKLTGKQYEYFNTEPFLTPDTIKNHATKFASVIQSIVNGRGVCMVYSNFVKMGAALFALALEEHGFTPTSGETLLKNPSFKGQSPGKYTLLTSNISEAEISKQLRLAKSDGNREGKLLRVIVAGPIVSEGVDFRYMRQIHVLDPWWNMSRIEQVVGRGLRTCSHQSLPFEDQNCTVYLHVVRTGETKECFDEYTYRTKVEQKATKIAHVRKVMAESAMDCPLQNSINTLPEDWQNLGVPQRRSEGKVEETFVLRGMLAPSFIDTPGVATCIVPPPVEDPSHVRPLSTYLDVRDEILTKLARLLVNKAVWERNDLFTAMRPYTREVVIFNIQEAVRAGFRFTDSFGRPAVLESKGELYALAPIGAPNDTLMDRITEPPIRGAVDLPESTKSEEVETVEDSLIDEKREAYTFPGDAKERFSEKVLNGFIFDHVLTDGERLAVLKSKPSNLPFSERLYIDGHIVLGKDTFEPPGPLMDEAVDEYRAWNDKLVNWFIEKKTMLFASLKGAKLTVSKMTIEGETPTREIGKAAKKFEPVVCDTGVNSTSVMNVFAKYIDSKGVGLPLAASKNGKPGKPMTGPQRCVYIELLAREENNCFWLTPQEMSVLYEDKANHSKFVAAFRK